MYIKALHRGSLMGPQSYNMFTNDMLFILDDDVDIYNYADDNTFVCSGYDYDSVKDNLRSFKIDIHDIIPDDVVKILGLHLDNNLNSDVHMSKLCKKSRQPDMCSR